MATPTNDIYTRATSGPVSGGRFPESGAAGGNAAAVAALLIGKLFAGAAAGVASASGLALVEDNFLWDAASGATGYRLYWGTSSGSYSQAAGAGWDVGLVTSYPLGSLSLSAGVTYYMVVRAYNASVEGSSSNEIVVLNGVQIAP